MTRETGLGNTAINQSPVSLSPNLAQEELLFKGWKLLLIHAYRHWCPPHDRLSNLGAPVHHPIAHVFPLAYEDLDQHPSSLTLFSITSSMK